MTRKVLNVLSLIFLLSVQIQAAFLGAHSSSSSSNAMKAIFEKLQNPKFVKSNGFDSLLMSTIQLKLKSGGSKLDEVLTLLDNLDQDLTAQQDAADLEYTSNNAEWQTYLDSLASQIASLNLQINSDEELILELTSDLNLLNTQLTGFNDQKTTFTNKRESLVEARTNDIQAYEKRVSEQQAMLDALEEIVDMLESKTTATDLIELKETIQSNLRKFKEAAGPYATLVGLTLTFDPEVVKSILTKLKAIQEALQASITQDNEQEEKAEVDYSVFLQSIDDTLVVIDENIQKAEADIVADNFELQNKQDAVDIAKDLVDSLTAQEKNIENTRDVYNANYETDKQNRNYEINTVRAAVEILRSHQSSIDDAEDYLS